MAHVAAVGLLPRTAARVVHQRIGTRFALGLEAVLLRAVLAPAAIRVEALLHVLDGAVRTGRTAPATTIS